VWQLEQEVNLPGHARAETGSSKQATTSSVSTRVIFRNSLRFLIEFTLIIKRFIIPITCRYLSFLVFTIPPGTCPGGVSQLRVTRLSLHVTAPYCGKVV